MFSAARFGWYANNDESNSNELPIPLPLPPPPPPSNKEAKQKEILDSPEFINSEEMDFSFMCDFDERHLRNGCRAVDAVGLWGWLRMQNTRSFMTSSDPNVYKIGSKMEEVSPHVSHSGCTFGLTMRSLEALAKKGYEKFKKDYLSEK